MWGAVVLLRGWLAWIGGGVGGPGLASEKRLSPFINHFDAASSLAAPSFPPS